MPLAGSSLPVSAFHLMAFDLFDFDAQTEINDLRVTGQDGFIQGLCQGNGEGVCIRDSEFHLDFGGAEDILSSDIMKPDGQQQNFLQSFRCCCITLSSSNLIINLAEIDPGHVERDSLALGVITCSQDLRRGGFFSLDQCQQSPRVGDESSTSSA